MSAVFMGRSYAMSYISIRIPDLDSSLAKQVSVALAKD